MPNRIISDLVGTMKTFFKLGTVRLKDNSTVLEAKNAGDSAYVPIAGSQMKFQGSTSGATVLQPAAEAGGTFTLPAADGSSGQVLSTNGSGTLGWSTVATGDGMLKVQEQIVAYNDSTPISIFTPPASATIQKVIVDVETAFDATGPANLSVGVSGALSQYMGSTDLDLTTVGIYEVQPLYEEDASPDEVIITFSAGSGGSAGSARVSVYYANPL